jgi:hypothetical protein
MTRATQRRDFPTATAEEALKLFIRMGVKRTPISFVKVTGLDVERKVLKAAFLRAKEKLQSSGVSCPPLLFRVVAGRLYLERTDL